MKAPGHSRAVILCIDDQETALGLRKRVLERAGYEVLTATSAHRAVEIFRKNHVDLVLTEHVLPALIGKTVVAATMKMLKPEVPIAIYSADLAEPEDMRFADMFITKLVSVDELLRTIKGLLVKDPHTAAA
ncbi:MAG TPA: response regulator [Terriglobales bacterium]|nr:response regulator [Terriglobales bacterium]